MKPSHISGKVSESGSNWVRKSMPDAAIRNQVNTAAPKPCQPKPKRQTQARVSIIVMNSTNGYCREIFAPQ